MTTKYILKITNAHTTQYLTKGKLSYKHNASVIEFDSIDAAVKGSENITAQKNRFVEIVPIEYSEAQWNAACKLRSLKVAHNSLSFNTALECVQYPGTFFSCGKSTGSGRYAGSTSWQFETKRLFTLIGLEANVRTQNVAPKGGRKGDEIALFI